MANNHNEFLQGILYAYTAVAEVTGKQTLEGMTQREWDLIHLIHARLIRIAAEESNKTC